MTINNEDDIKKIKRDTIFFFLLIIATIISFYIIIEKKKILTNQSNLTSEDLNKIFRSNRQFIFIIDAYFAINAFLSFVNIKNNNESEEADKEIIILFIATSLNLIASFLFLFIRNTLVIEDE